MYGGPVCPWGVHRDIFGQQIISVGPRYSICGSEFTAPSRIETDGEARELYGIRGPADDEPHQFLPAEKMERASRILKRSQDNRKTGYG